jgi:hypothetical protein
MVPDQHGVLILLLRLALTHFLQHTQPQSHCSTFTLTIQNPNRPTDWAKLFYADPFPKTPTAPKPLHHSALSTAKPVHWLKGPLTSHPQPPNPHPPLWWPLNLFCFNYRILFFYYVYWARVCQRCPLCRV